ncbi:dimethylamine monooxygenase subunit DmmA family protein [Pseudomonas sp. TE3610]
MTPAPHHYTGSVPRYTPLVPCTGAVQHLIVAQCSGAAAELAAQLPSALLLEGSATGVEPQLAEHLRHSHVGSHLYLIGEEAFIWHLHALARSAGLGAEEISAWADPTGLRRLYCVHCATLQEAEPTVQLICQHCSVRLAVREHFSRRLGAYMAVCADADQPFAEART